MSTLTHLQGDATKPVGAGSKIIVHCCNDLGAWGAGFVLALSRRWPQPEQAYRAWATGKLKSPKFQLGAVHFVEVADDITVANLIGQHGVGLGRDSAPPIRYEAIRVGLRRVAEEAKSLGAGVHMPKMGAGLAGGDWPTIEAIVRETLVDAGIPVVVYTF